MSGPAARVFTLLILAAALPPGCFDALQTWETQAEWTQAGLWEMFPSDGSVGDFEIETENSSVALRKWAWSRSESRDLGLSTDRGGNASFSVENSGGPLNQEATWELLNKTFATLGLGGPTLDPGHQWQWSRLTM